jgi:hypothetical protein
MSVGFIEEERFRPPSSSHSCKQVLSGNCKLQDVSNRWRRHESPSSLSSASGLSKAARSAFGGSFLIAS